MSSPILNGDNLNLKLIPGVTQPADTIYELSIEALKRIIDEPTYTYSTAQKRICYIKVARIYRRVVAGYYFGPIKIDDDMIVEGNHRFLAYTLAKIDFEITPGTRSHCDESKNFKDIVIDTEQDWDANNSEDRKYCDDTFLEGGNYRRLNNQ